MTTQMKFIRKIADGEVVKTIYPMGYNMQKELHSKKFNECLFELFKVLHYRKLRLCLYNPNFRLRNKAVRMGIAKYQPSGDRLGNRRFCLEIIVDDFKLAILQARQYGVYNNCYYTIKDKLVNRINKKDIPYCYDYDFEIEIEGDDRYEDQDGVYYCTNNGQEDWRYRVLSNDNNGVDDAIMTYLTDEQGIYNCSMDFLRDYIRDDIKYYEIEVETDDEDAFDDADRVECPCCMEKFEDLPQNVDTRTIRCGHTFCEPCITNWINQDHNTCPLCRKDIEVNTTEERDNDELINYMNQENPRSVMENWFNDKWEMIDAMKEYDGLAHTLGYDDGDSIEFSRELDKLMFSVLTGDTLEVLWLEN